MERRLFPLILACPTYVSLTRNLVERFTFMYAHLLLAGILMTSAALYAGVCLMSRPMRPYGSNDSAAKKFIVSSVTSPLSPLTPPGFEERAPTPTRRSPKRRPSDLTFSDPNTNIDFVRHTDDYSPRSPGTTLREGGVLTTLLWIFSKITRAP